MRKWLTLVLAGWGSTGAVLAATELNSKVDQVVIYNSGATVTRVARVALQAGENPLRVGGMLPSLNARQVRVSLDSEGVQLGQVSVSRVPQSQAYNRQVQDLQAQIEAANDQIAALEDDVKDAQLTLKFLDGLAQGYAQQAWSGSAQGQADVAGWRGAIEVLSSGGATARKTVRDKQRQISQGKTALSKLQRELAQLQGRSQASKQIDFTVAAARAQDVAVSIEYFVRSASWKPQYEARLSSAVPELTLFQQASVQQTTGEDWPQAKVTLSTSQPSGALQAPQLPRAFLNLQETTESSRRENRFVSSTLNKALLDLSAARVLEEDEAEAVQVNRFSVSYHLPGRIDLPSRAERAQTFDIERQKLPVELTTVVVPQRSQQAFLTANVDYQDGTAPLYGSQMEVYVDGTYVGASTLPTLLPGDKAGLPMGQDRRVDVTVLPQGAQKDTSGLVSRRKEELTSVVFEVTNRGTRAAALEVYDRYPVAEDKVIEVDVPRSATPPTERDVDDQPGIVVWRKTLAPNEQWRISHQYQVSYPASRQLVQQER